MSDRRSRLTGLLVALVAVGVSLAGGWLVTAAIDLPSAPEDYNVVGWEVRHFANKWLYQAGTILRGEPDEAEKSRRLERFLALNAEIAPSSGRRTPSTTLHPRGTGAWERDPGTLSRLLRRVARGRGRWSGGSPFLPQGALALPPVTSSSRCRRECWPSPPRSHLS
jgi:hypothetical protein